MLKALTQFFSQQLKIEDPKETEDKLQLAAATLLIEVNRASLEETSVEQKTIKSILQRSFNLSEQSLNSLVEHATAQDGNITSLYPFVRLINENYTAQQRNQLVKMLWEVAMADQEISIFEEHAIRKIADLLHVPHDEFIKAKLEVLALNT